jgi:DNA-binding transcriptional LysR family regulator
VKSAIAFLFVACVLLAACNNSVVGGRRKAKVHVSGPIASRDINSAAAFVYRGHGSGLLPSTYCDDAIGKGKLIRVLPKWTSSSIPVFAVYSSRKFLPLRLNVFLEALAAWNSPLWLRE